MADPNSRSNVPIYISIFLFLCFGYGIYDYFTGFEENGCEMTYMYEYPQFVVSFLWLSLNDCGPQFLLVG